MANKKKESKKEIEAEAKEEMGNTAKRYEALSVSRSSFLKRAREASQLTIPSLIPPESAGPETELYKPFQSVGARGLNNLASKLLLTLLPPNETCFKLGVDQFELAKTVPPNQQNTESGKTQLSEIQEGLAKVEKAVMLEIETTSIRIQAFEGLKHVLCGGNVCLFCPPEGGMRVFHLDRYVVKRDPMGHLTEIITKESVDIDTLPKATREFVESLGTKGEGNKNEKPVDIFTHVLKEDGQWYVKQECRGQVIPGSTGKYGEDNFPWIVLRYTTIDGEDYGRGFVEEYQGDLYSLEGLAQAIVEGSAAAAKVLFLVNPNGTTNAGRCADARNGSFVEGDARDVTTLQLQKQADMGVAANTAKSIEERLSYAFLLNSAIQRNGERVTAEEIRYLAQELETGLGGVYSIMSQEFQLPLIKRIMSQMEAQKRLPKLPKKLVKPKITTGIEALGRGNDADKLDGFIQGIGAEFGTQVLAQYINVSEYLSRRATSRGVDPKGLVKDQAEVNAANAAAQQQAMMAQAVPNGVKAAGDMLLQRQQQQAPQPPTN